MKLLGWEEGEGESRHGRPAMKLLGGGGGGGGLQLVCGRPILALSSAFLRHLVVWLAWKIPKLISALS